MGFLQRHLVAETLKIFFVTMGIAVLLMTFGGGAKEGLRNNLPPLLVLELMPYVVMEMLVFTTPGCLLFAVCSVFGRFAASNEMTAVKSLGVHPFRLVWPVLVVGYVLSIATFLIYDVCAAWSRPNLKRLVVESVAEVAYGVLKSERSFSTNGMSIIVKGVRGRRLLRPVIEVPAKGSTPAMTLTADEAELGFHPAEGTLRLTCYNTRVDVGGELQLDLPDRFEHDVPIAGSLGRRESELSPAALSRQAMPRQIVHERNLIAQLTAATHPGAEEELAAHRERLNRLIAEPNRRLANGFACLGFALVGIPVSLWFRSADNVSAFFVCFLPILVGYYPLLVIGETLARQGYFPSLAVWLADAVLLLVGGLLLRRSFRH